MNNKSQEPKEWKHTSYTIQQPNDKITIVDEVKTSFIPGCHIKKISKTEYMTGAYRADGSFVSDGIVYEIAKKEEPMRNRRSLRQIFRNLRQLIANNYAGGDSELFCTLTYRDQHNDPEKLYNDFEKFWKRLKYKYPSLKYIAITEPHASGMFHIHLLLADISGDPLYIPHDVLESIWGQGFVQVERLDDIDHMGAYFIAYFTNMELTPDEIKIYTDQDDIETKNGKSYIKGKRLDFYPESMQIYRYSRNCTKPARQEDASSYINDMTKTFEHTTTFEDHGNSYYIHQSQYKSKK